jgi:hypothetical protein
MASGKDLFLDPNKRVLVYGRSGSGKTSLIGKVLEVPEMCPLYVFDFDLRINSILAVVQKQDIIDNLTYDQFRDGAQAGKAFTDAETKYRELAQAISGGKGPRTIAMDSLTFMEKSIMSRVLMMDGKAATFPPQLNHYKAVISQLEDFVSKLCALPVNIIVTAHEDVDKDEITGQMVRGIGVTGKKLPSVLPGYFNEVWYAEIQSSPNKPPEHKVRVSPTSLISARTVYSNSLDPLETQDIWKKLAKLDGEAHANKAIQQMAS